MKTKLNWRGLTIGIMVAIFFMASMPALATDLIIPDLNGSPFDNLIVPVTVKGFVGVAGVQVRIRYDDANLTIDSVTAPALYGPTINASISGEIHVIWEDYLHPVTLADDDVLIYMYFEVAEGASGDAFIEFFDERYLELANEIGDPFDITVSSGTVHIEPTDVDGTGNLLPLRFELRQNYPNPFNPSTNISYTVEKTTYLTLEVYSISGRRVDKIDLGRKNPGTYSFVYRAADQPSGVYLYRLSGENFSLSRQMILLK